MDLLGAFRNLARPSIEDGPNTFTVVSITGTPHRIGKDGTGAPVLLIRATGLATVTGPVVLQHITVTHDARCRITADGHDHVSCEEIMSLVRCVSGDPALREHFVRVVGMVVRHLGDQPSPAQVGAEIKRLTELFRVFEQPARRTVQGLWAELLVILLAAGPEEMVTAWHVDPDEAFDFSTGRSRLEVKSFSGEARVHSFSLRQLRPGHSVDVVVVSLRAERSSGGVSIADLLESMSTRGLSRGAFDKVELLVARSLGDSAGAGLRITFDAERARNSLRFFDASSIPCVEPPLPAGVLSVRVDSLLEDDLALAYDDLASRGGLFRCGMPTQIRGM